MSNTRKLRTREFTPSPHVSVDGAEAARDGETCAFHPDCCDQADMGCPGCGQPAIIALTYRVGGNPPQRVAFCEEHFEPAGLVTHAVQQRQESEAN